jgi:hypothetical protein
MVRQKDHVASFVCSRTKNRVRKPARINPAPSEENQNPDERRTRFLYPIPTHLPSRIKKTWKEENWQATKPGSRSPRLARRHHVRIPSRYLNTSRYASIQLIGVYKGLIKAPGETSGAPGRLATPHQHNLSYVITLLPMICRMRAIGGSRPAGRRRRKRRASRCSQ